MARRPDCLFSPAATRAARTRAQAATWAWAGKVASRLGRFRPDRAQPSMEIGRPSAPSGGSKGTRGRRSPKTLVHSFPPLLSLAPHATAAAAVVSVGADEGWCRPSLSGSPSFLSRASLSLSAARRISSNSEPRRRRRRRRRHHGPSCRRARSPSGERAAVKRLCVGALYLYPSGCISATNIGAVRSFPHDGGDGSGEVSHWPCFSFPPSVFLLFYSDPIRFGDGDWN